MMVRVRCPRCRAIRVRVVMDAYVCACGRSIAPLDDKARSIQLGAVEESAGGAR